jgi:hypothetical protein
LRIEDKDERGCLTANADTPLSMKRKVFKEKRYGED